MTDQELRKFLIEYEVKSSWWTKYISFDWMQELAARYFAWKVERKIARLNKNRAIAKILESDASEVEKFVRLSQLRKI